LIYSIYHNYQNLSFWCLNSFSKPKNGFHTPIKEENIDKSTKYQFHGGGKALLFSTDLHEEQY
jgi:hypothetical protein